MEGWEGRGVLWSPKKILKIDLDPAMRGGRRVERPLATENKRNLALGPNTSPGWGAYGVLCGGGAEFEVTLLNVK